MGEAVPTRSIEGIFGFSASDDDVSRNPGDAEVPDPRLAEARSRAFRKLDEWLTWIYVLDDESIFTQEFSGRRMESYRFVLGDVITEPVDVLRYSLKTTALLF